MDTPWQNTSSLAQVQLIARSLKLWTGRDLLAGATPAAEPAAPGSPADARSSSAAYADRIFHAPFVLVSHGTETDPVLNYGNQAALTLWEMSWDELTRTPSRLTAESPHLDERARLLAAVTTHGFIDDYSGIRVSRTGRRFRILRATVWNLLDNRRDYAGQAALFSRWDFL